MKELSAEQIVALATAAAFKIAKENEQDELALLSDFFVLVGTVLLTISDRNSLDK